MSIDLNFWKEINDMETPLSAFEIYEKLSEEENVEWLVELPIEKILDEFKKHFHDWDIQNNINFEKDGMAFDISYTSQYIRCDCYSVSEIVMNEIIDIMINFGCPLYDSALDERFEIF